MTSYKQRDGSHLRLVDPDFRHADPQQQADRTGGEFALPDSATAKPSPEPGHSASDVLGQAVMHAAMSWVACCMEKPGESVDVVQVGRGAFHATVHFADGGTYMLAVSMLLETGPVLTVQVQPIHP